MNHIFSHASSVPHYFATAFKETILPQLTDRQKTILVISSIAVAILTAMVIAYRCCFSGNNPPFPPTPITIPPYVPPRPFPQPLSPVSSLSGSPLSPLSPVSPILRPQSPILPLQSPIQPPKSPHLSPQVTRTGLECAENEIGALQEEIHIQRQLLEFALTTKKGKSDEDGKGTDTLTMTTNWLFIPEDRNDHIIQLEMEQAEAEIKELQNKLDKILATYPNLIRKYLENKFSLDSHRDSHEIYQHLVMLSGFMEANADNQAFIQDCLKQIDAFLTHSLFTSATELCLQEQNKTVLIIFHQFLSIVDKHIEVIAKTDRRLALRLKVKLANLPLTDHIDSKTKAPKSRQELFPNAHLSEREQVGILVGHFQFEEDQCVAKVILKIRTRNLSAKDLNKLSKMISDDRSRLSSANKRKLQDALENAMGTSVPTGSAHSISATLKKKFKTSSNPYVDSGYHPYGYDQNVDSADILTLHRASKAKQFFENQLGLPENQIHIPRWYHATNHFALIINSGQVNVEHRQAYEGAWVSTQRQVEFGNSAFVFNHRIAKLDPNVFIGWEGGKVRWRGLQTPIPLVDKTTKISNISLFGIFKGASKADKQNLINSFKKKGLAPVIVSVDQVDYIQRGVIGVGGIGNPDLTAKWWGKADETHLDRQPHQYE